MRSFKIEVHNEKLRELVYDKLLELGAEEYCERKVIVSDPWIFVDESGTIDGFSTRETYLDSGICKLSLDELFAEEIDEPEDIQPEKVKPRNLKIAVHDPKLRELVYDRFLELGAHEGDLDKEYCLRDPWLVIDGYGRIDGYDFADGYEESLYREITLDELFAEQEPAPDN